MQRLEASIPERARVVFVVPRWLPEEWTAHGLPYRVFPVLSSLARCGIAADFVSEVHDGLRPDGLRSALEGAAAGVVWLAELNPAVQIGGLVAALDALRQAAPDPPRFAGGGFFPLFPPPGLDLEGLADEVIREEDISALARAVTRRLGLPFEKNAARYDAWATSHLDLAPFIRPEPMIFGNAEPSLQLPTGYGCARRCTFCFYERTKVQLLPGADIAELMLAASARLGVRQFLLGELDFFTSRKRVLEMVRTLEDGGRRLDWFALVSVPDVLEFTDEEFAAIARSGCRVLELGSEVGSARSLAAIGKTFAPEDAILASERLLRHGIVPLHNILLGFVGETRGDRLDTIRLVRRLRALDPRMGFNFRVYQPTPGTTMGEAAFRHLPPLPKSLSQLASYRLESGRALPWLDHGAEREVRFLVNYVLPLAYGDTLCAERRPSIVRRVLRGAARCRCRTGFFHAPFDHDLFRRLEPIGLPVTFLP